MVTAAVERRLSSLAGGLDVAGFTSTSIVNAHEVGFAAGTVNVELVVGFVVGKVDCVADDVA